MTISKEQESLENLFLVISELVYKQPDIKRIEVKKDSSYFSITTEV